MAIALNTASTNLDRLSKSAMPKPKTIRNAVIVITRIKEIVRIRYRVVAASRKRLPIMYIVFPNLLRLGEKYILRYNAINQAKTTATRGAKLFPGSASMNRSRDNTH